MADPTRESLCRQRLQELDEWREWSRLALIELGGLLIETGRASFDEPAELSDNPSLLGLGPLDELLCEAEPYTGQDSEAKMLSLVIAYLGEYLIHKFSGHWIVDTNPDSPSYARYLIAARSPGSGAQVNVDVGDHAVEFLASPKGRSLLGHIIKVERSIVDVAAA